MIRIYGAMSSRAHRVIWMLKELDLPFEHVQTSFLDGSTRRPEFLALNPNGRVPVLVDGDFVIHESMAVNLYLAQRYGEPSGLHVPASYALAIQWSFWVVNEVEGPLLFAAANRQLFPPGQRDESQARMALEKLDRPLRVLDQRLAGRAWLLEDRFSVADLNVATVLDLAPQCGIDLGPWPHVEAWLRKCLARPAARDWKDVAFSIPRPGTDLALLKMFI